MAIALTPAQTQQILELLRDHSGLRIPPYRHGELMRAVHALAQQHTWGDIEALLRRLATPSGADQLQELVEALTVGESYFFRDKGHFAILEQEILPEILQRRHAQRTIRIWSAACANGEEPYSLAILLHQMGLEQQGWHPHIVGTDVDRQALARARQAVYRPWSLRQTPDTLRDAYFEEDAGYYRLRPPVRERVIFQHLNLVSDVYPDWGRGLADFDLILCRNVLIYFDSEVAQRVIAGLYKCLAPGGWLLVSAVEAVAPYYTRFQAVRLHGITVYRRPRVEKEASARTFHVPPALAHRPVVLPAEPTRPDAPTFCSADPTPSREQPSKRRTMIGGGRSSASPLAVSPNGDEAVKELLASWLTRHDEAALACLNERSPREVGNPHLACDVARMYAGRGQWEQALVWLERAETLAPDLARVHYWRGVVAHNQDDLSGALAALRRAVYLAPDKVLAHLALASVWRDLGDPKRAIRALDNTARQLRGRAADESVDPQDEPGLTVRDVWEMIRLQREVR